MPGLRCGSHVLRVQLRIRVYFCVSAHDHHDVRLQYVLRAPGSHTRAITQNRLGNAIAQLLTVPPYAVAAVVLGLFQYSSDRLRDRGSFAIASSILGALGYAYGPFRELFPGSASTNVCAES